MLGQANWASRLCLTLKVVVLELLHRWSLLAELLRHELEVSCIMFHCATETVRRKSMDGWCAFEAYITLNDVLRTPNCMSKRDFYCINFQKPAMCWATIAAASISDLRTKKRLSG
jgi:hypothetical protein